MVLTAVLGIPKSGYGITDKQFCLTRHKRGGGKVASLTTINLLGYL